MHDISGAEKMLPIGGSDNETAGLLDVGRLSGEDLVAGQLDAYPLAESGAQVAVRGAERRLVGPELLVTGLRLAQDRPEQRVAVGRRALDGEGGRGGRRQLVAAEADVEPDAGDG